MRNFKFTFILTCLILFVSAAYSADLSAKVDEISGKVEKKQGGGAWTPVTVGDVLSAGDSISTGFNSKAVLILGDTSVLVAKDLTRLTLAELYAKEGTVVTDLFLDVGNIRTEVHSSDSVSNDFTVRNANSTASVRGTVLDVEILGDGNGMKVMAWDGMAVITDIRTGRQARVGEQKKKKKAADADEEESNAEEESEEVADEGDSENTDAAAEDTQTDDSPSEMALPPEPPAEIAAAPVMASGNGGGMVSSMAAAIASTTVTVSTKPPSPQVISTGGGSSASTETAAAVTTVVEELTGGTTVIPVTTSNVNIQVVWPE